MPNQPTRQTAFKCWVSDISRANYILKEGWDPNYLEINGKHISRLNILAHIVDTFLSEDENYGALTIDDNTDTIRVKAFREDTNLIRNFKIGDTILLIGRPRQYNGEVYLTPEIIKKLDNPNWELVRKLELIKIYGKPKINQIQRLKEEIQPIKEEIIEENLTETSRQKILTVIGSSLNGEADMQEILNKSDLNKEEVESILKELLKEGEIYEKRPNIFRVI